ncbi:MAG: VWA domain-containing protein, partial [Alphaproteobacteria bacterium]
GKNSATSVLRLPGLKPPGTAPGVPAPITVRVDTGFDISHLAAGKGLGKIEISDFGTTGRQIVARAPQSSLVKPGWNQLSWKSVAAANGVRVFSQATQTNPFVLVTVTPRQIEQPQNRRPREVVFVLDNSASMSSASMSGVPIRQAKKSISLALSRLTSRDRFNVITFNDRLNGVFRVPEAASAQNIERARRFVETLETAGGSEMLPALRAALVDLAPNRNWQRHPAQTRRPFEPIAPTLRQVVFLTDGAITDRAAIFDELKRGLGRARLFTVGFGVAPSQDFMEAISALGGGTFTHIARANLGGQTLSDLFALLETPVLTDVHITWPETAGAEIDDPIIANVYGTAGLEFTARLKSLTGQAVISGYSGVHPWSAIIDLSKATPGTGIAKRWTQTRTALIEHQQFEGASRSDIDTEIAALALATGSITRVTGLSPVALPQRRAFSARAAAVPNGWDFSDVGIAKHGGAATGLAHTSTSTTTAQQYGVALQQPTRHPVLIVPYTSADAGLPITIAIIALAFALALGVAFVAWTRVSRQPFVLQPTALVRV